MNISHFRLILFNLKIFGEIVTTIILSFQRERVLTSFLHSLGGVKSHIAGILFDGS